MDCHLEVLVVREEGGEIGEDKRAGGVDTTAGLIDWSFEGWRAFDI